MINLSSGYKAIAGGKMRRFQSAPSSRRASSTVTKLPKMGKMPKVPTGKAPRSPAGQQVPGPALSSYGRRRKSKMGA